MQLIVLQLYVVEEFAFSYEVFQSEAIEVFLWDEQTVVEFIDFVNQGRILLFDLKQFFVCEEMWRVGEPLQFVVEHLNLFGTFIGPGFQLLAFPKGKEGYDEY